MFKQKPFPFSVAVLAVLIILHLIGSYYSWYWSYPRFEIIIHVLAGLWAGSIFLWLASCFNQINSLIEYKTKSLLIALLAAALLGVFWELLENLGELVYVYSADYQFNTAVDLLNDMLGGVLAYLYFIKKTRSIRQEIDLLHPFYNQIGIKNINNEQ